MKIRHFAAPPDFAFVTTALYTFSYTRGADASTVGRTVVRFATSLSTRPSTYVGRPTYVMPHSSVLPNEWDSGSHRYCRSSGRSRPISSVTSPCQTHPACSSSTPLGRPVVPDV